jgi:hypothetical protein
MAEIDIHERRRWGPVLGEYRCPIGRFASSIAIIAPIPAV